MQERGHKESALAGIRIYDVKVVAAAPHDFRLMRQFVNAIADFIPLTLTRKRAHVDILVRRIADPNLAERFCKRCSDLAGEGCRSDHPTNRGALLTGLAGHLTRYFFDEKIELGCPRCRVGPEYRRIQRVGLGRESNRFADDAWVLLQEFSRVLRARECNRVLTIQMVEQ